MGMIAKGRRITWQDANNLANVKPGDYWHDPHAGVWFAACPVSPDEDGFVACLALLFNHRVTEHEDGTITVSPSVLCKGEGREYHGFLERGIWRSV